MPKKKNRVDKGRNGRTTGHNHKHAKKQQYKNEREQPELFALHKETQHILKKFHSLSPVDAS